jgi:hypothetical protein
MAFEAQLKISDGTTEISLIDIGPGIHLNDWTPAIAQYKGGGVFRSNPQSSGRRLVQKTFDNAIETFDLKINNLKRNTLIFQMQELSRLLEKATDYWTSDWQNTVVYLIAQAECEDNPRYAEIVSYSIPQLDNPYGQPFLNIDGNAVFDNITLAIERKHWKANIPGNGTAIQVSSTQAYDSRTLGRTATANEEEVFTGNQHTQANLTDVYVDDGGVFGSNLMDAVLPFSLLPATPVANDAIYFGIDTSLADSGPFSNLIFDIGTINLAGRLEFQWEYWDSGAWAVFNHRTMFDGTSSIAFTPSPLDTDFFSWQLSGVRAIQFFPPSGWATTAVNGVTGYWVRARVIVVTGGFTVPTQQNRLIYSAILPYIDIAEGQVLGDIPALSRVQSELRVPQSQQSPVNAGPQIDRAIVGLRSVTRGSTFTAFLNCADEQDNSNYTTSVVGGLTSFANEITSPTGRKVRYNPTQIENFNVGVTFVPTSPAHFYGTYHVFVRARQIGGDIGDINIKIASTLQTGSGTASFNEIITITNSKPVLQTQTSQFGEQWFLIDMGLLSFLGDNFRNQTNLDVAGFSILFNCTVNASIPDVDVIDVVLIPVDEWAGDYFRKQETLSIQSVFADTNQSLERIDANGIAPIPEYFFREEAVDGEDIKGVPIVVQNNDPILQANVNQRLWYVLAQYVQIDGSHTGANNQAVLTDATADFINVGVSIGDIIVNDTDDSEAVITAVTATSITGTLVGGTDNDWDTNDIYYILTTNWGSRGDLAASIFAQKNDCYLGMRGDR